MKGKFFFYWFSFILNLVATVIFTTIVNYNLINATNTINTNVIIGSIIIFIYSLVYILADITGINLLRKLNRNKDISRRSIIYSATLLLFQLLLQVFLAYIIFSEMGKIITISGKLVMPTTYIPILIWLDSLLVIIFITALINLFSILKLIKKVRLNYYEINNSINKIGTEKLL